MRSRFLRWLCALALTLPVASGAQTIQRCEAADGRISYSDAECPAGTKPVKALSAAPAPSPQAQQAARDQAARDAQAAQKLAEQRRVQQAATEQKQREQRTADCAYLRGEIDSIRRLRNALVNRPYYSLDDLDSMDRHASELLTQYRRVCTP
jgi:hypothetical protein